MRYPHECFMKSNCNIRADRSMMLYCCICMLTRNGCAVDQRCRNAAKCWADVDLTCTCTSVLLTLLNQDFGQGRKEIFAEINLSTINGGEGADEAHSTEAETLMQAFASMKRFPPTSRKGIEYGNRSTLEPNLAEKMITPTKSIKPQTQGVAISGSLPTPFSSCTTFRTCQSQCYFRGF
jgi:hypothetical protein